MKETQNQISSKPEDNKEWIWTWILLILSAALTSVWLNRDTDRKGSKKLSFIQSSCMHVSVYLTQHEKANWPCLNWKEMWAALVLGAFHFKRCLYEHIWGIVTLNKVVSDNEQLYFHFHLNTKQEWKSHSRLHVQKGAVPYLNISQNCGQITVPL